MTIKVTPNPIPVAVVTPPEGPVKPGYTVTLVGSGTDSNGTIGSYSWTRTGGTSEEDVTVDVIGVNTATLNFMADAADTREPGAADVTHVFTLIVTDDDGAASAPVITTVTDQAPPLANAGPDQPESGQPPIVSSSTVILDGSGSRVASGRTLKYAWTRPGGTESGTADALPPGGLMDADTATPSFTVLTLEPGVTDVTYVFELVVTDNEGAMSAPATVTMTAVAVDILVEPPELKVQEGDPSAYQVRLSESPRLEVEVIAFSDNEDVVLENVRLVFNAENWDARQRVEITTLADSDKVNDIVPIRHRLVTEGVAVGQSGDVRVTVRDEDPILPHIGEYLETRASTLLNNSPELTHFLKQDGTTPGGSGGFTFKATNGRLALDGGFVRDGVRGEVTGSYANSESRDMKLVLGSFGIHRKYSENLLAGAMLQLDFVD